MRTAHSHSSTSSQGLFYTRIDHAVKQIKPFRLGIANGAELVVPAPLAAGFLDPARNVGLAPRMVQSDFTMACPRPEGFQQVVAAEEVTLTRPASPHAGASICKPFGSGLRPSVCGYAAI